MDVGCPSDVQWKALMDYIEPDPEMLHGNLTHPTGKARVGRKWESLAIVVNAADRESAQKSGKGWKSAWNGLKGRARKNYRDKVSPMIAAGLQQLPDPYNVEGMSDHYRRVVALTGTSAAMGPAWQMPQVAQEDPDDPLPLGAPGFDQIVEGAGAAVQENEVLHEQGAGAAGGLVAQNVAVGVQPKVDEVYFIEDNNAIIEFMNFVHQPDHEGGAGAAAIPVVNVKQEPAASDTEEQNVPVITLSDTPIKIKTSHTPPSASGYTPGWKKSKGGRLLEQDSASGLSSHSEGFFALPDVVKHEVIEEPDSLTPHRPAAHWLHSGSDPGLTNVNVKTQLHGIVLGNTIIMKSLIAAFSSLKKD